MSSSQHRMLSRIAMARRRSRAWTTTVGGAKRCHSQWSSLSSHCCVAQRREHGRRNHCHPQPQRHFASSAFPDFPIPESIKDTIKSSLLEHASKDSSYPLQQQNGHINGYNHGVNSSSNSPVPAGSVNDPIDENELLLNDPLDDLYIQQQSTRYWPQLPPLVGIVDPVQLADQEIRRLAASIRKDLIGTDHPVLNAAASYFFESSVDGGKKVRPMLVLLLSRALADSVSDSIPDHHSATTTTTPSSFFTHPLSWQRTDLPAAQRRLAEISEMIHTASLFHDDVIDGADTRRGRPAVHTVFGNKMAILAGDYLLARASICLARLRNVQVVETMSTIIEHLVRGEVMQMRGTTTSSGDGSSSMEERVVYYLQKNFYKTGSLMANSCKSAALLGEYPAQLVDASYRFGKHVGMAFQLVDDILDFEGSLSQLGKPALADLQAGLATAPVLFAAEEFPELNKLIDRKFKQDGDVEQAVDLVFRSSGIERTKVLARLHAEHAMDAILQLGPSEYRDALVQLAYKVVSRTK